MDYTKYTGKPDVMTVGQLRDVLDEYDSDAQVLVSDGEAAVLLSSTGVKPSAEYEMGRRGTPLLYVHEGGFITEGQP